MTWDDVVKIGEKLPGVEVSTWYGRPALKVTGKGFCAWREDIGAMAIRVDGLDDKEALLQGNPDVYWTTPHYDGHAMVLVRLEEIEKQELAELVEDGWLSRGGRPVD